MRMGSGTEGQDGERRPAWRYIHMTQAWGCMGMQSGYLLERERR